VSELPVMGPEMLIVLDTNVLVSRFLNAFGKPGRILDLLLAGSVRIAAELRLFGRIQNLGDKFYLGHELMDAPRLFLYPL